MRPRLMTTRLARATAALAATTLLLGAVVPASASWPLPATRRPEPAPAAFARPIYEPRVAAAALGLPVFAQNLDRPTGIFSAGDGSGRIYILEKPGRIRVYTAAGTDQGVFLNITGRVNDAGNEQGLLGLAFAPGYASNGRLYVAFTDSAGALVVAELRRSSATRANAASYRQVIRIPHPGASNHDGGMLNFGKDGYLYISTGDGGGANDQFNNAPNRKKLLGKILRINPVKSGTRPYTIPAGNPYATSATYRHEIWAYGLRNTWRWSFDRSSGDIWLADVGQDKWEEVNHVKRTAGNGRGKNFGWHMYEGNACFRGPCSRGAKVFPVATYQHGANGCSITGGYVYRGSAYPAWKGRYLFGDYCSGRIWWISGSATATTTRHPVLDTALTISAFGQADDGELLVASDQDGKVYRMQLP